MRNKRVFAILALALAALSPALAAPDASSPYATISYAEGSSFFLIRENAQKEWQVSDPKVFGMEIKPGDIIRTSGSTFIEISIRPIRATVQIAENTSYRCDADASGSKSTGELYYGRVRAKVAKLAGGSSFRISSPSLVAGVRGTNFGCDVIAPRAAGAATLNRVFCFEGSVAVSDAATPDKVVVTIAGNEMVEQNVSAQPATATAPVQAQPLAKAVVSPEVRDFWEDHPIVSTPLSTDGKVDQKDDASLTEKVLPDAEKQAKAQMTRKIVVNVAIVLVGLGAALLGTSAGVSYGTNHSVDMNLGFTAGGVMLGSGAIIALVTALSH